MDAEAYTLFMQEAVSLAKKAKFETYPNPQVGAVLVSDGVIRSQGYHTKAGAPHAEIECLEDAQKKGVDVKACTLVVTLEPCRHQGKTPPCTEAIIQSGIKRVVIGMRDPTENAGGGKEILESHGIEVIGPVLQDVCADLLADFLVWKKKKRPYILLKMAASLDGRIATRSGQSKWISNEASREKVQYLRASIAKKQGVVLVGGRTFRADNPKLTVRDAHQNAQPRACILTSHLPLAKDEYYLLQKRPTETIFFSSAAAAASTQAQELRKLGVRVFSVPQYLDGTTDLQGLFRNVFSDIQAPYVLCEGGGQLARSLLEANLIDEFYLHLAPLILADNGALPLFSGRMPLTLQDAIHLRATQTSLCGQDIHILLRPNTVSEV